MRTKKRQTMLLAAAVVVTTAAWAAAPADEVTLTGRVFDDSTGVADPGHPGVHRRHADRRAYPTGRRLHAAGSSSADPRRPHARLRVHRLRAGGARDPRDGARRRHRGARREDATHGAAAQRARGHGDRDAHPVPRARQHHPGPHGRQRGLDITHPGPRRRLAPGSPRPGRRPARLESRAVRPHRGERLPVRQRPPVVDVLDRRGSRVVQQHPTLPAEGAPASPRRRRAGRGDDQLLLVRLRAASRRRSRRHHDRARRRAVESATTGSSGSASRAVRS